MEALAPDGKIECKTMWISDVHLGSIHCKAQELLQLLGRVSCERLYLVGDIVDIWAMHRRVYWPDLHNQVLREILRLSRADTEIIYIPGNHDMNFREFCGGEFGRIKIQLQALHKTLDGKAMLITHGDELDSAVRFSRVHRAVGDVAYDFLMGVNRRVNHAREIIGQPYWSLSEWVKLNLPQAEHAIRAYQEAAVKLCHQQGTDGIICGHLHHPAIEKYGSTLYCNDGDWVENCSALFEDFSGELHLIRAIGSPEKDQSVVFVKA